MATRYTDALRDQFQEQGFDLNAFAADFDAWKKSFPAGEFKSYVFGKDGAYSRPLVGGQPNVLRHVHLVPLSVLSDKEKWDNTWRRHGRKVSDRALVYAQDPANGYLLLFILDEPQAHEIALMKTPDNKLLMAQLAQVAEHFIQTGEIIA